MQQTVLFFSVLLSFLHKAIEEIKEPRARSNGTKYKISDGILAAFSISISELVRTDNSQWRQ
jgi:hypothetical protein